LKIIELELIQYECLKNKKFKEKELNKQINKWAHERKFNLIYTEGVKETKHTSKRTFGCDVKNCQYKLIFKSEKGKDEFQLCEKLSSKYNKHSNSFFFFF